MLAQLIAPQPRLWRGCVEVSCSYTLKSVLLTISETCNSNPGFKPVASGGDGAIVQYWYVGYDTTLAVSTLTSRRESRIYHLYKTVIVGYQVTSAFLSYPTHILTFCCYPGNRFYKDVEISSAKKIFYSLTV